MGIDNMTSRPRWMANDGSEQKERLPVALQDGYIGADEMSLADLVRLSAEFAKRLEFVSTHDAGTEQWDRWFRLDEALVLADIAVADIEGWRAAFLLQVDLASLDQRAEKDLQEHASRLDQRIVDWRQALSMFGHEPARTVCKRIKRLQSHRPAGNGSRNPSTELRAVFFSTLDEVAQLRDVAKEQLEISLGSNTHDPSAGLFLTFLHLYQVVQKRINTFTGRLADFYYRDCLHMAAAQAESGSVHLACRRVALADLDVVVPKGADFALGKDTSGQEIVYRADDALQVTPVAVAALHTLRLERSPWISPEYELGYVSRAKAERLPVPVPEPAEGRPRPYWELFGGARRRIGEAVAGDAEFGFVVASPLLLLQEGAREVRIGLRFVQSTDVEPNVADLARGYPRELPDDAFKKVDEESKDFNVEKRLWIVTTLRKRFLALEEQSPNVSIDRAADLAVEEMAKELVDGGSANTKRRILDLIEKVDQRGSCWDKRLTESARKELDEWIGTIMSPAVRNRGFDREQARDLIVHACIDAQIRALVLQCVGVPESAGDASGAPTLASRFLMRRLLRAGTIATFCQRFGRLFCRWMLVDPNAIPDGGIGDIQHALKALQSAEEAKDGRHGTAKERRTYLETDVLSVLYACSGDGAGGSGSSATDPKHGMPERGLIFHQLLMKLFDVDLTGPDGWFAPDALFVKEVDSSGASAGSAVTLVVRLHASAPPVVAYDSAVHGAAWGAKLPCVRVRLSPASTFFPYSMLTKVVLRAIDLAVDVEGARDVVVHNAFGRLDPSKPFNPFGPIPGCGSYLVFGSAEVARKNVTRLKLNIEWGGLPEGLGGFETYYQAYGNDVRNQDFKAATTILRDGQWVPANATGDAQALFRTGPNDNRLWTTSTLEVDEARLRNYFRPLRGAAAEGPFELGLAARGGFFKLTLTAPQDAFGHKLYPQLLTDAVSANARRRPGAAARTPIPNPPYTPLIERLALDYQARWSIDLAQETPAERSISDEQVLLLHPFGFEEIYPAVRKDSKGAIPAYAHDGNLFVGLSADGPPGVITLLFHLRDESARRYPDAGRRPHVSWSYLASNQWRPLQPKRVLSDTTHGFLTSGIVTLDIPDDIDSNNTIMRPGLYWLCAGADDRLDAFAALYSVTAQALRATRVRGSSDPVAASARSGTVAEPLVSIPGLVSVAQVGDGFGGRPAESGDQFHARVGERLRHKNRALGHWDYERLVLERFPAVFKVKCFACINGDTERREPGCVTVVVVPASPAGSSDELRAPKLNAVELDRIKDYLASVASPFARIFVRNAIYERIQVRCAVRFRKELQSGHCLKWLNQQLIDRISPLRPGGIHARFDWSLSPGEVETWIREADYVEDVARVSLLQVSEDDAGRYALGDSARLGPVTQGELSASGNARWAPGTLRPTFPWSLALPMRRHDIVVIAPDTPRTAGVTGIKGLEIGNTFVIAGVPGVPHG